MSGRSRQSGDPTITCRMMFHARMYKLMMHAPNALEELRRMLSTSHELEAAYRFVQRIYSVHDKCHLTPARARKRVLKAWSELPPGVQAHFPKFRTAVTVRSEEYFANWEKGATNNAVTEALNRSLRGIYRAGRGLTFDELRLRAIYSASPTERAIRRKNGELDPIAQAKAMIAGEKLPRQRRRVTRHGFRKPGERYWKEQEKQMDLFDYR